MSLPPPSRVDTPTTSHHEQLPRAAAIGKILLWAIGIPLLVVIFALAAMARCGMRTLENAASPDASAQDDPRGYQR
jgi:hypothetical protein